MKIRKRVTFFYDDIIEVYSRVADRVRKHVTREEKKPCVMSCLSSHDGNGNEKQIKMIMAERLRGDKRSIL